MYKYYIYTKWQTNELFNGLLKLMNFYWIYEVSFHNVNKSFLNFKQTALL